MATYVAMWTRKGHNHILPSQVELCVFKTDLLKDPRTWDMMYEPCNLIDYHHLINNPHLLLAKLKGNILGATGNQLIISMCPADKQWMVKIKMNMMMGFIYVIWKYTTIFACLFLVNMTCNLVLKWLCRAMLSFRKIHIVSCAKIAYCVEIMWPNKTVQSILSTDNIQTRIRIRVSISNHIDLKWWDAIIHPCTTCIISTVATRPFQPPFRPSLTLW